VPDSVTVVEWGRGIAEQLATDRLEIDIWRAPVNGVDLAKPDSERIVIIRTVGPRWSNGRLAELGRRNGHG
jgi:tRNA threonylcarbamoyladenosine biosynthesis protein TsaE